MNSFEWNFIWNAKVFFQENAIEKVVCRMSAILFKPHFIKYVFSGNISVIDWEFSQTNFAACDGAMLFGAVLYLGLVGA